MLRDNRWDSDSNRKSVLASVAVGAGADRVTLFRLDRDSSEFKRIKGFGITVHTPRASKYGEAYQYKPQTGDIIGLCNIYDSFYDEGMNIKTEEGRAAYLPIIDGEEMLLIVLEKDYYKDPKTGKLYLESDRHYSKSGEVQTEVKKPEFRRENMELAHLIATNWKPFLFDSSTHTQERIKFLRGMQDLPVLADTVGLISHNVKGYFGAEMSAHIDSVGRLSKLALSHLSAGTLAGKSLARYLPKQVRENMAAPSFKDFWYHMAILHDGGKMANPRHESSWDGSDKSEVQSVRSKQHSLFSEILLNLPAIREWEMEVWNHHTERGYYNRYGLIAAITETADKFDAMTGKRRDEGPGPRSFTAVEAMVVLTDLVLRLDDADKYTKDEEPPRNPSEKSNKVPAETGAMRALALKFFLENGIFESYAKSRESVMTASFNPQFGEVKTPMPELYEQTAGGKAHSPEHNLQHFIFLNKDKSDLAKISKAAGLVTGLGVYDEANGVAGQELDKHRDVKAKLLDVLNKYLERDDVKEQLEMVRNRDGGRGAVSSIPFQVRH